MCSTPKVKRLPYDRARATKFLNEAADKLPENIREYVKMVTPLIAISADLWYKAQPLLAQGWKLVSGMQLCRIRAIIIESINLVIDPPNILAY